MVRLSLNKNSNERYLRARMIPLKIMQMFYEYDENKLNKNSNSNNDNNQYNQKFSSTLFMNNL